MKRTMIRVMLVDVRDEVALALKQAIEELLVDLDSSTIEFTIAELPAPPPIVRTT